MLATLVAVGLVGGFLSVVISTSLPLVFPRLTVPGFKPAWVPESKERKFPVEAAVVGLVGLIAAYAVITLAPAALGANQDQLYTAFLIAAGIWAATLLWRLGRAVLFHDVVETLAPGDPDHDFAFDLAKKSGIGLKEVRVGKYAIHDARPVVAGVVSLHIRERTDLTEQERQVILTERVAALQFTPSSTYTQAVFGAAIIAIATLAGTAIYLVDRPHLTVVALAGMFLLGRLTEAIQKKRLAADQRKIDLFVLQSVGDFELVERTISAAYVQRNRPETHTARSLEPSKSQLERLRRLRSVAEEHGFETPLAP